MKMGLRKQQNLLHWLNKKLSSFFSRFNHVQPPPPGKKKSPVSSIGPTDHPVLFFFWKSHCHHRFNTGVAIFLRLALSRCVETIANWGSWPVKTMQSNRTQLQQ
jgi:hypothetical protein